MQMRKLHIGKREGRERERERADIYPCVFSAHYGGAFKSVSHLPMIAITRQCNHYACSSKPRSLHGVLNETAGPWTISPAQKLVDKKAIIDMNIPALYSNWNLIPEASFTVLFRWMGKSWLWKLPRHEVEACFCAALLWNGVSDTKAVRSLLCL